MRFFQDGYTDTPFLPGNKWRVHDKARPRPTVITPPADGPFTPPPADALVLFDGKNTDAWTRPWKIVDGAMEVTKGLGSNETREKFGDMQLHLEFATPVEVKGNGQGRGNSGVIIQGRYEVQVLDSYNNETYADGQCGAVYGQNPPLVNACRKPGEWQAYDIFFTAPKFASDGKLESPAYVTVVHNGMLLHIHRAMHAVIDRNPHHGIHFRVLAKILRLSGGDHLHSGTVVGKLEGDRAPTLGFVDLMRESFIPEDRSRGVFFDQDWGSMPGVFPVASGGIHVWHMPALVNIFGDDSILQFGGGTLGHPWGNAAGACANRVALEACVQARNEGRDIEKEGAEILTAAATHSPELKIAMETWKEIKFEFDTVDKLDIANK